MINKRYILYSLIILILYLLTGIKTNAQSIECSPMLIKAGTDTAEINKIIIKNNIRLVWGKGTPVKIEIPHRIKCSWVSTNIKIGWETIKPQTDGRNLKFKLPKDIEYGQSIEILGLKIKNCDTPTRKFSLKIRVGEDVCDYKGKILPFFSYLSNIGRLGNGELLISSIHFSFKKNAKYLFRNGLINLPPLIIKVNKKSFIPKNHELSIIFPKSIADLIHYNNIKITSNTGFKSSNVNLKWSREKESLIAHILLKRPLKSGQELCLENIRINTSEKLVSKSHIELLVDQNSGEKIRTKEELLITNPSVRFFKNPGLTVNLPPTKIPVIEFNTGRISGLLQKGESVYLSLPENTGLYWDRTVTTIEINNNKISDKISYLSNKIAYLEVDKVLKGGENYKISGLKVGIRNDKKDDYSSSYRKDLFLKISFGDFESAYLTYEVPQSFQIAHFILSSIRNQEFCLKDPPTQISPIKIIAKSNFPCFQENDTLIVKLPDNLKMTFSRNIARLKLGGTMSKRIKKEFFINSKTLGLTLSEPVLPGEELILSGLVGQIFANQSIGNLELFHSQSALPLAKDLKKWMVSLPIFFMSDNQVIFSESDSSLCYELNINTGEFSRYFDDNKEIWIKIPDDIQLEFNLNNTICKLYGKSNKYLEEHISYVNDKIMIIDIRQPIPSNTLLRIGGIEFGQAGRVTQEPKYLLVSYNQGSYYYPCENSLRIVSANSDCNKSEHYCKLANSNFRSGDTLTICLKNNRSFQWDAESTQRNLKIEQSKYYLDIENPIFTNDYRSIRFKVIKGLDINAKITFSGLYISHKTDFHGKAYITIKYKNLYGTQETWVIHDRNFLQYDLPLSYLRKTEVNQLGRLNPLLSYTYPMIVMNDKAIESIKIPIEQNIYKIPEFTLRNGKISQTLKSKFDKYKRTMNNVPVFIEKGNLEAAQQEAEILRKNCPDLWYGYYQLAQVYKQNENLISQARSLYQEARSLGFNPNDTYPALFADDADDEMNQYIDEGRKLLSEGQIIAAEEKFLLFNTLRDSLDSETIGRVYYWLGRVAYKLKDYEYALDYFQLSQQYGYYHLEADYKGGTDYLISECKAKMQSTSIASVVPNIESQPPPKDQNEVAIRIIKPNKRQNPVILRRTEAKDIKARFNQNIIVLDKEKYQLEFHPIAHSLKNAGIIITIGAIVCGIIYL